MQPSIEKRWHDLDSLLALIESAWLTDEHPLSLESRNYDSDTPLHTVITWGDIDAVSLLIKVGSDANAKGEDGNTPLHHAILMSEFEIARLLLANGANKDLRNEDGKRAQDMCWEGEWKGIFGTTGGSQ